MTSTERKERRHTLSLWGLAIICMGHGLAYSYVPPYVRLPKGLEILTEWIPIQVFGAGWIISALLCAWFAARRRPGWLGVAAAFIMTGMFGTFYSVGTLINLGTGESYRQVVLAAIYLGIVMMIAGSVPRRRTAATDPYPLTRAAIEQSRES